jgi:hypothetical protein
MEKSEGHNDVNWLFQNACKDRGNGEGTVPLRQVSSLLAADCFVTSYCAQYAGKDSFGNAQVTEAVLEQLTLRFGSTVDVVLAEMRALCSEPWFVSSEGAFEERSRELMTQQEGGYGAGDDVFGVCFGPQAPLYIVLRMGAGGLTKHVVERHQLDSSVKALQAECCACDPSLHWTTLIETNELVGLWAKARCGYGSADDGILLPLSQVSAAMAEDDSCATFCIERAGADSNGNPLVSEKLLEQLACYFGRDVKTALLSLHDVTGQEWFLCSVTAFEHHCMKEAEQSEAGYGVARVVFGVYFGDEAPHYVLHRWDAQRGVSTQVLARHELVPATKALQDEGGVALSDIRWTTKLDQRAMQRQLLAEAAAYGCVREVPGLRAALSIASVQNSSDTNNNNNNTNTSNSSTSQPESSLGLAAQQRLALLSGHSYRFARGVKEAFPDATRADWTCLLQWALSLPCSTPFYRDEKARIFDLLSEMFIHSCLDFAKKLINESFLPEEERTVKPDVRFGGIAGGKSLAMFRPSFKLSVLVVPSPYCAALTFFAS